MAMVEVEKVAVATVQVETGWAAAELQVMAQTAVRAVEASGSAAVAKVAVRSALEAVVVRAQEAARALVGKETAGVV